MSAETQNQEKMYQILMSEVDIKNLMAFLNRVDLRGKEVPALLAINNAVRRAKPVEKEAKEKRITEETK